MTSQATVVRRIPSDLYVPSRVVHCSSQTRMVVVDLNLPDFTFEPWQCHELVRAIPQVLRDVTEAAYNAAKRTVTFKVLKQHFSREQMQQIILNLVRRIYIAVKGTLFHFHEGTATEILERSCSTSPHAPDASKDRHYHCYGREPVVVSG